MPPSDRPSTPAPEALVRPLARLLRPLVRLLMQSGITFPVLADLLRGLYVEVALRDVLKDERAQTDSRISLLTGVHRKEVRRLRSVAADAEDEPAIVTISSQIIARWLGGPPYSDRRGRPLRLPRVSTSRRVASFEGLVRSVTTDVRPRAVLDELQSQNIVALEQDDQVRLNVTAFVPRPGRAEQLYYFGRNLADHIAAASANITAAEVAPFLERSVHYDRLSAAAAGQLDRAGRQAAERLLIAFNRRALAAAEADDKAKDASSPAKSRRINLGIYLFVDDDSSGGEG